MELINTKEKRVLGALHKLGDSLISTVAKETLINRSALYYTIDGLIEKGLVTKISKEGGAHFQAIPLSEYESWAKRQLVSISKQTEELQGWLETQKKETPTLHSDIRYFEGFEGVKNLYDDTWRDNKEKMICAITDYDKAYATLNDFLEKEYFPRRIAYGVRVRSLLPRSKAGKRDIIRAKELLRDMRFIDVFKNLGIELNIYGSKVSIVAFDEKKPSGIIIKNKIIAEAFKALFEYIWKTTQKK